MTRHILKCGGRKRRKALFGADGALTAAATLTAAGITAGATAAAAKQQSKAMIDNAKQQAQVIKEQTANNNALQKEQLNFTRAENQENRQQQQDIQTTLQMLAGQQNMNDRNEQNKIQVKYGGRRKSIKMLQPLYGGGQFQVIDGGGVLPISITPEGYGLYELYGNDHDHYHKTSGGKNKTGVGIKFNDGSIVEGEGNQNTNKGELLYVTPDDAVFISKHNIDGFNPREAVMNGANPVEAFNIQEILKAQNGLNDDGSKRKHRSIKRLMGGYNALLNQANMTQNPNNGTASVAGALAYSTITSPVERLKDSTSVAKCGKRIHLKCGGRRKAQWGDWAGATYTSAGNLLGAGITTFGNMFAANRLGRAYNRAGNILANAYSQMHGIDMSELNREDYEAPHTLAVVRQANTNINPQLERIRRNADYERREINRGTISSVARQQRLAATNDRMYQQIGEQYAYKNNADEQIKQGNAERITQTAQANADRDAQARKDYTTQRLSLLQYNNDIENAKIAGIGQARADALTQASMARAQGLQTSMNAIGSGISASGQAFGSTAAGIRKEQADINNVLIGADTRNKVDYLIANPNFRGNYNRALNLYNAWKNSPDEKMRNYAAELFAAYGFQ